MTWTQFHDMHSGGSQKLEWPHIFIEAPEQEAKAVFYNRFGRSPDRVTCTCCGGDYTTMEFDDLAQATGFERNCLYNSEEKRYEERVRERPHGGGTYEINTYMGTGANENESMKTKTEYLKVGPDPYVTLEDFIASGTGGLFGHYVPLVIFAKDIQDHERMADLPDEGYVWVD